MSAHVVVGRVFDLPARGPMAVGMLLEGTVSTGDLMLVQGLEFHVPQPETGRRVGLLLRQEDGPAGCRRTTGAPCCPPPTRQGGAPMTEGQQVPDGTYVEWRGRTYRGSPVRTPPASVEIYSETPERGFLPGRVRGFRRVLAASEVTVFRLSTTCRWRGARFAVRTMSDGRLDLLYLGTSQAEAESLGLVESERTVFGAVVDPSEVTDLRQERAEVDLAGRTR